jgi:hypothetical protein
VWDALTQDLLEELGCSNADDLKSAIDDFVAEIDDDPFEDDGDEPEAA